MTAYRAPLDDMQFLMSEVFQADKVFASMPGTSEVTPDLINAILKEAAKIAEDLMSPINQNGDHEGCTWADGVVTTPMGFKEAYTQYVAGGWAGLTGDIDFGGQGMPKLLSSQIEEMFFGANSSFALYAILNTGAALTLSEHAAEALKQRYLPKMYEGRWTGTMCLTEPHAGTDLGMIRTRAVPQADGSYRITGTKIFITAGEHDLTENIIHLVLAKLPDAPAGPKGISLFVVPKYAVDDEGGFLGHPNGVACGGIEQKMGIKGSATCVLNFDGAHGWLVGGINNGLSNMFTMMNYERLSMGLQSNGLADSSYQIAVAYARERIQGRAATGPQQPGSAADPILVHPDVRRMLLTMRANIMAGRALSMYAATQLDISRFHPDAEKRRNAHRLVALLIPIAKAYCSDRGFDMCVMGQQVLGGHGYVAEWGLEQNVRDARIAQIYEGANGIQALDLMGRKTVRTNGELLAVLFSEMDEFVAGAQDIPGMDLYLPHLLRSQVMIRSVTRSVIDRAGDNPEEIGAASYAYMELLGLTLYNFMWLRILSAVLPRLQAGTCDIPHLSGLVKTAEFFFARLLPRGQALVEEIEAGAETLMAPSAEEF